jgi:hypothetical protein
MASKSGRAGTANEKVIAQVEELTKIVNDLSARLKAWIGSASCTALQR